MMSLAAAGAPAALRRPLQAVARSPAAASAAAATRVPISASRPTARTGQAPRIASVTHITGALSRWRGNREPPVLDDGGAAAHRPLPAATHAFYAARLFLPVGHLQAAAAACWPPPAAAAAGSGKPRGGSS